MIFLGKKVFLKASLVVLFLVELVTSTGATVSTVYVFLLFGIHQAMVAPMHYAESVDQVPFLFVLLFQIALHLSHTARCPCCIIINEETGRPLLNFIQGLDI